MARVAADRQVAGRRARRPRSWPARKDAGRVEAHPKNGQLARLEIGEKLKLISVGGWGTFHVFLSLVAVEPGALARGRSSFGGISRGERAGRNELLQNGHAAKTGDGACPFGAQRGRVHEHPSRCASVGALNAEIGRELEHEAAHGAFRIVHGFTVWQSRERQPGKLARSDCRCPQ